MHICTLQMHHFLQFMLLQPELQHIALLKKNLAQQVLEQIYVLETIPTTYDQ